MKWKCIIDKIDSWYYDVKYGIENIIKWVPVIWKDRNWDNYYIYVIFRHKLNLMEKQIREYGHHLHNERDADNIKVCVNLLDRLIADDYMEMAFKRHNEKWGSADMIFSECEDDPNLSELNIDYPNVKTEEDEKRQKIDFKNAMENEGKLREQDLDLLFKNMRKYIQTWWD